MKKYLTIIVPRNNLLRHEILPVFTLDQSEYLTLELSVYQDEYKIYPWNLSEASCYLIVKQDIFSNESTYVITKDKLDIEGNTVLGTIEGTQLQKSTTYLVSFVFIIDGNKFEHYLFRLKVI